MNAFNQEDPDYKLRVESLYDEGMNMELLNTQLIAGEGPDIFAFCYYDNLTRLGPAATEDLLPYLDADAEYSRETIVPSLLAAMSPQGKLAALPYAFSMVTFTAPSDVFAEPGISFDEAKAAAEAADLPIFPPWMAQDILWGWMSNFAAVQFTDLEAGTCSFDSEAYLSLLRECGETSTELPADISQNNVGLLQFETLQNFMRLGVISERCGGEYTFAGMPNDETNGSMFSVDLSFAISAQSKYKDGAWRFVRECLSPEAGGSGAEGSGSSFPASAERLEKLLRNRCGWGVRQLRRDDNDKRSRRGQVPRAGRGHHDSAVQPAHRDGHPERGRLCSISPARRARSRPRSTARTASAPGWRSRAET